MRHNDYAYFLECESRYVYEPGAVAAVLEADAAWCKRREGLMQRRAQEKEERKQLQERQREGQERKESERRESERKELEQREERIVEQGASL